MWFSAEARIARADAARDARDWGGAIKFYSAALRRKPILAPIWVQLGHAHRERGELDAALAAYRRADLIRPNDADTLHQMARTLRAMGETSQALEVYGNVLKLAPALIDAKHESVMLRVELRQRPTAPSLPHRLAAIVLGTVGGHCSASCLHCPTGKAETASVPSGPMPWEIFTKIIDGIVELGLIVTGQISFGLFGDGLLDPLVVERAAYVRRLMPSVRLTVNTNAAAFNAAKHAGLNEHISTILVHCESLNTRTYNRLMRPLRLERVLPKIEQMFEVFPGKICLAAPISRLNKGELPALKSWFLDRGAMEVTFIPLSARCAEDRSGFDALAFDPHKIACPSSILDDLIVDCDGQVLICCNDFQRVESVGDLQTHSVADVLAGVRRFKVREAFDNGDHDSFATCSRCYADIQAWEEIEIQPASAF